MSRESRGYDCVEITNIIEPVDGELPTYTATITSSDTVYITVEEDVIKGKIKV